MARNSSSDSNGCILLVISTVFGFIGFSVGEFGGALIGAVVGLVLLAIIKAAVSSGEEETSAEPPPIPRQISRTSYPTTSKKRYELRWVPAGEAIKTPFSSQPLTGPIYVSRNSRGREWEAEPSAIDLELKVAPTPSPLGLDYWPSFAVVEPGQRRVYIDWLLEGRRTAPAELGYVFMFFYGLERRVLVENDQNADLTNEAMRLLRDFGAVYRSRSFSSYMSQFLHFSTFRSGLNNYGEWLPKILGLDHTVLEESTLDLVLAYYFESKIPLPAAIAEVVVKLDPRSTNSIIRRRAPEKFSQLFAAKYRQLESGALSLKASKRPTTFSYRPASRGLFGAKDLTITIPYVRGVSSQFKPLLGIWQSCLDELSDFSRVVKKQQSSGQSDTLERFLALPKALQEQTVHPLEKDWRQLIENSEQGDGIIFNLAGNLAALAGISERPKLLTKQKESIGKLAESFGYRIAPELEHVGGTMPWDQEIALVQIGEGGTKVFPGTVRLLYLITAVAASDDEMDEEEFATFNEMAAVDSLPVGDRAMIKATEALLRRNPQQALSAVTRICNRVPKSRTQIVATVVAQVAAADGVITPGEQKILSRIYKALQLEPGVLDEQISTMGGEVTVLAQGTKRKGEPIAKGTPSLPEKSLDLDMARVRAIAEETREVTDILTEIFVESDEASTNDSSTEEVAEDASDASEAASLMDLESRYQEPARTIFSREEWSWEEFTAIAEKHHLMAQDLFDGINAWADETLGDFILEQDGSVQVFTEMLRKETNA